jgi:prepilin-type N-terminal cleavage/methylation domain-containing protein/prepilin-type processing-associated H-X9-DG protein
MTQRTPRRFAFTLVELLVVIGIIAVLIGILLPVLSRARKTANITKCSSALRQIAYAFNMYSKENHDKYPSLKCEYYNLPGPSEARSVYWQDMLMPYTARGNANMNQQLNATGDAKASQYRENFRKSVFWGCPEWQGSFNTTTAAWADIQGVSLYETGYGYNWMPLLNAKSGPGDWARSKGTFDGELAANLPRGNYYPFSKWTPYADKCLVTEATLWLMYVVPTDATHVVQNQPTDRVNPSSSAGWNNLDRYRHGKYPPQTGATYDAASQKGQVKINILYADGHVDMALDIRTVYHSFQMRDP